MELEQLQAWEDCKVAAAFLWYMKVTLYYLLVFLMLAPVAAVAHRASPLTWHLVRKGHYGFWVVVVVTGTGLFFKVVALAVDTNERIQAVFKISL